RIHTPTTSWPCSVRSAAATDESTPPDIATRTLLTGASSAEVRCDPEETSRALAEPSRHPDALAGRVRGEDGRRGPGSCEDARDDLDRLVELLVGRRAPERDPQRAARLLLGVAH